MNKIIIYKKDCDLLKIVKPKSILKPKTLKFNIADIVEKPKIIENPINYLTKIKPISKLRKNILYNMSRNFKSLTRVDSIKYIKKKPWNFNRNFKSEIREFYDYSFKNKYIIKSNKNKSQKSSINNTVKFLNNKKLSKHTINFFKYKKKLLVKNIDLIKVKKIKNSLQKELNIKYRKKNFKQLTKTNNQNYNNLKEKLKKKLVEKKNENYKFKLIKSGGTHFSINFN